jgi:hypothetical protein
MPKEPYLGPEIKSETLEAGALGGYGSPDGAGGGGNDNKSWLANWAHPSFGVCCDG